MKTPPPRASQPVVDRLMELLAIPGASGQEGAVAAYIRQRLLQAGAKPDWIRSDNAHRRTPSVGQVGNLVLKLPGNRRGKRRLFVSHMDTVPLCVGTKPVRRSGRIESADARRGLGADNRAGVAVTLETACRLVRDDVPHPPATFLWTVQEEVGLQGARVASLSLLGRPVYGFNWDGGSASKLTLGATGGYRFCIRVEGKASHAGGAPERGVSAIVAASLAISRLHQQGWHGLIAKDGRVGTSNIGVMEGGAATNVVADQVVVQAEARSHDPKFRQTIIREIEKAFRESAKAVHNSDGQSARVDIDGRLDYESFCLATNHPCVVAAQSAVRAIGREPELTVANGGLDANWLTARGIPTVSLGCGQLNQHTVDEALEIREFVDACRIALELAHSERVPH